jgi:hypothetical protein
MSDLLYLALGIVSAGGLGWTIGAWRQYKRDSAALWNLAEADMIHAECAEIAQRALEWGQR